MSHLGDLLSAVVDGELSGAELDRANAHLAACDTCRGEAQALRRLKDQLRALADDVVCPGDITDRLLAISAAMTKQAQPAGPGPGETEPAETRPVPAARLLSRPSGKTVKPGETGKPGPRRAAPRRLTDRRRGRQVLWGTLSIVVVGIGSAAFGLGGSGPAGPSVVPQLGSFDAQHGTMSGNLTSPDQDAFDGLAALTGRARPA